MNLLPSSERVPLRRAWRRLGGGGKCCAVLAGGMLALAAWKMVAGMMTGGPDRAWPEGVVPGLTGLVWAVGVAVASRLPVAGYAVTGIWLGWHGVSLMGVWTGTPGVSWLVMWWLAVGLAMLAWRGPRRRDLATGLWLVMALGAGYLIAQPSGWSRMPWSMGDSPWSGRLVVSGVLALAGWWLLPRLRRWEWTEPGFGKVLAASMGVAATGLAASQWRDAEGAAGWAWEVVDGSGFLVSVGWFWFGGFFAVGLVRLSEWGGSALTGRGRAARLLPVLWLVVTALEWLWTHSVPELWATVCPQALRDWVNSWPGVVKVAARAHTWVGIAVLVMGFGFLRRRDSGRALVRLNSVWAAAWVFVIVLHQVRPDGNATGVNNWMAWLGPLAVLVGGGTWAMGLMVCEGAASPADVRSGLWGGMVLILGMLLARGYGSTGAWADERGSAAMLGGLHMALPQVLYHWWTAGRLLENRPTMSLSTQAGICGAGMLGVLLLLHRDVATVSQMAICPVWWLAVLLWLRGRQPTLRTAEGALAGGLLGSVTIAVWSRPDLLWPAVPMIPWLNIPAGAFPGVTGAGRPYCDPAHFTLFFLMSGAGALLGALVFRDNPGPSLPLLPLEVDSGEGRASLLTTG